MTMSDYDELPEQVKQNVTREEWEQLMSDLAEVSEQARGLLQHG